MNSSKLRHRCRLMIGLLTVVFLAVLTAVGARTLLASAEQRRLESICSGSIYDASGEVMVWSEPGQDGIRHYPCGEAGSALVGYRSGNHGSDGIELICRSWLLPEEGDDSHGDVYLTVDSALQQVCYESIKDVPAAGVVVMDAGTGGILAMTDTPSFAPEMLDKDYEGIVSRGCVFYNICAGRNIAPGAMFRLPACAAAVQAGDMELAEALVSGSDITGMTDSRAAVETALSERMLVGQTISLDCMDVRSAFEPEDAAGYAASLSGYGSAAVSPVQVCMYTAALARSDGSIPRPYVIDAKVSRSGERTDIAGGELLSEGAFSAEARALLRSAMTVYADDGCSFEALTAEVTSGSVHNVWLTACVPADNPRYALTMVMQGEWGSLTAEDAVSAAGKIIKTLI